MSAEGSRELAQSQDQQSQPIQVVLPVVITQQDEIQGDSEGQSQMHLPEGKAGDESHGAEQQKQENTQLLQLSLNQAPRSHREQENAAIDFVTLGMFIIGQHTHQPLAGL